MTHRGVLIGCGFFARNHMEAWARQAGVRIVGVCDTDLEKAQSFATAYGAEAGTDAAGMLARLKPDFVDIATTVGSHRALVELAADHARMVICQKPFAETLDDATAMVDACAARGVALMVHENFRWQRPMREIKARIGLIGTPRFLRLSFRHGYDIYANQPYLARVRDLALMDVGLHLFDMARFLVGDVARVTCETQRRNPAVAGEDAFTAVLRHRSGAVSSVECSFHSTLVPDPFPQTLAVLEGDDGTLELVQDYRLRFHSGTDVREWNVEPDCPDWGARPWHLIQESVVAFQAHVVAVLDGLAEAAPSGADNVQTLRVTFGAIASARTGQTVGLA